MMKPKVLMGWALAGLFAVSNALATPPAPIVSITSPADNACTHQASLAVVVAFQANPGNVQDIDLLVDGQILQTFTNPPNIKDGTHTFTLALGGYPEGTLQLQAQGFQGNRNANLKGVSSPVHVMIDRTAPTIGNLVPADGSTVEDSTPACSATFADSGCGVNPSSVVIALDAVDVTAQAQVSASGFSFTPAAPLQDGSHTLAVSLADKAGNPASAQSGFSVQTAPPITPETGFITGRVYDATTEQPLAGARIILQGVSGAVFSDAQGRYAFPSPTPGFKKIELTRDGYHYADRGVDVVSTRAMGVPPVYLMPVGSSTPLVAAQGGVATVQNGDLVVTFPPGALPQDADVTLSLITRERDLPGAVPDDQAMVAAFFGEPTVVFNTPVQVRIRNFPGLPAGSRWPIAFWDRANQKWLPGPLATVTADGQFLEGEWARFSSGSISGRIFRPPTNGAANPTATVTTTNVNALGRAADPAGFSADFRGGHVSLSHAPPPVRRRGVSQAPSLSYRSETAAPDPVVGTLANLDIATTLVPGTSTYEVEVGGTWQTFTRTGAGGGTAERIRLDGSALPTGAYPVRMRLSNDYGGTFGLSPSFGAPATGDTGVPLQRPRPMTGFMNGRVIVENNAQSPYGKGWDVTGLQRLRPQPDGSVLMTEGGRGATLFDPGFKEESAPFAIFGEDATQDPQALVASMAACGDCTAIATRFSGLNGLQPGARVVLFEGAAVRWSVPFGEFSFILGGGLAFSPDASRLVALIRDIQMGNDRILEFDASNGHSVTLVTRSNANNVFLTGIAVDSQGEIYAHDDTAIYRLNRQASTLEPLVPGLPAGLYAPGMGVDAGGRLYLVHRAFERIRLLRFTPGGEIEELLNVPPAIGTIQGLAVAPDGTCYLAGGVGGNPTRADYFRVTPQGAFHRVLRSVAEQSPFPTSVIGLASDGTLLLAKVEVHPTPVGDRHFVQLYRTLSQRAFTSPEGELSVLTREPDGSYRRRMKDGTLVTFSPEGLQTAMIDLHDLATTYAYTDADGDGKAEELGSVTGPTGEAWILSYANGKLSGIADAAGRTTPVSIDGANHLTRITNPDGTHRDFGYDSVGRALSATDENGATLAFALDRGRLSRVTFPPRPQVRVDAQGNAVETTASEERVFAPSDLLGLYSDLPEGVGTPGNPAPPTMTADLQAKFRDGLAQETRYRTDVGGRATEIVDALNRRTTADRNLAGDVVRLVRPNLTQAFFFYDVNNPDPLGATDLVRFAEGALAAQALFEHTQDFHKLKRFVDFMNHATTIDYTLQGDPRTITDALNHATHIATTADGLPQDVEDALHQHTLFSYDPVTRNLLTITNPLNQVTRLTYTLAGQVETVTDPLNRVTRFVYDLMGRLIEVHDARGGITRYSYDLAGNMIDVEDALHHHTTFSFYPDGLMPCLS